MLKNYFKIAYRNLLKNKVSSFINIIGLSIAIAVSIVVYLFLQLHLSTDTFHENAEKIYIVGNIVNRDGTPQTWGDSPTPLGPAMAADFPQIEHTIRVGGGGGTFQYEDKVFNEGLWFVDEAFLDMFTFPLKYGDRHALSDKNAVILSEEAAVKYFGLEDPVGKHVTITFNNEYLESFTVRGVAEEIPTNASFGFNMLINYEKQRDIGRNNLDDWSTYTNATFFQLKNLSDLETVTANMDRYLELQNAASDDWPISAFTIDNLPLLSRHAWNIRGSFANGVHPAAFVVYPLIAVFLLLLSCFNYMNIAIATAARRLKEIGVRKVVGSSKNQLVAQFLSENILLCLLALVLGALAAHFIIIPSFNQLFEGWPPVYLMLTDNLGLWIFFIVLLVITGVASGAYPAFYVSAFKPVTIFAGKQQIGGKSLFTRSFLTFQFVLAFITMIAGVVFSQNGRYQMARDWGYDQEHTLVARLTDASQYKVLENEMRQNPNVINVAGSSGHLGRSSGYSVVEIRGEKFETVRFDIGFDYLETMKLRLTDGRFFDRVFGSDAERSIIINETFAHSQGWTEPVGELVTDDSTVFSVIGVVEDFHYYSFFDPIQPALFRLFDENNARFLAMRVEAGTGVETEAYLSETWKHLFPDEPYDSFFQDSVFDGFFRDTRNITKIFTFTALMALVISCMGLFGLASQNITRRMREISIRKVLGASVSHVTQLVHRGFFLLLAIAAIIATPLTYYMLNPLLDSIYEYRIPIDSLPFILAFVLVFVTAIVTVSTQIYRVATTNPAEVLRNE